jgi:hypothetical protein
MPLLFYRQAYLLGKTKKNKILEWENSSIIGYLKKFTNVKEIGLENRSNKESVEDNSLKFNSSSLYMISILCLPHITIIMIYHFTRMIENNFLVVNQNND